MKLKIGRDPFTKKINSFRFMIGLNGIYVLETNIGIKVTFWYDRHTLIYLSGFLYHFKENRK